MVSEKLDSHSSESIENSSGKTEKPDYPPFDPDKAKELIAKTKILSSAEEISDENLRQKLLNQEERMRRDEEIVRLANEAEARLGRDLSQAELQDIAEKYDAYLKNPNKESEQSPESKNHKSQAEIPSFDPTLYANGSERRAANSADTEQKVEGDATTSEYDFKNADRYQEDTFLLAAADSLMDSPDTGFIDKAMFDAKERASKDSTTEFEALKQFVRESDVDKDGGFAATDLMNAFIDTTSTYIISKDEKIGRGFAKGLLTSLEMLIDGFTTDKPNPYIDTLRIDLSIIKPLADEFINGYDASYDSPSAFRDYLRNELEMREIDMRGVKRRGGQISPDMERETQAIKTVMSKLEEMQSNYDKNLKNLHDTAYAHHRVIK